MTEARARSLVENALRHHWALVLVLGAVLGAGATWALDRLPVVTYRATQGYVVAAVEDGPVTANSDRAARDYATVLRTDDALITRVAQAARVQPDRVRDRLDVDDVRDRLEVGYLPGSGTVFARYEAESRREVLDVMAALDRVLVEGGAPAGGIGPETVRPLGLPPLEKRDAGLFPGVGLVAGLLMAAAGAVLLERVRPRLSDRAQVRETTGRSVLELTGPASVDLLVARVLVGRPERVHVLVRDGIDPSVATAVAERLAQARSALVAAGQAPVSASAVSFGVTDAAGDARGRVAYVILARLSGSLRAVEGALEQVADDDAVVVLCDGARLARWVRSSVPA